MSDIYAENHQNDIGLTPIERVRLELHLSNEYLRAPELEAEDVEELLKAYDALLGAQGWQDISTAPKNKRIGLLINGVEYIGRWEDDRFAQKPRPYWQHETFGRLQISDQRKEQPTMWRELRAPDQMIADQRGEK